MAAPNTRPIFSRIGKIGTCTWTNSTTANTKSDGTGTIGTDMLLAFTADATNGSFVQKARIALNGTTAATATTATVLRIYTSTKASGATTNADTWRWDEVALPSQTTDQTTTATTIIEIPLGFALPASGTILISCHHAAASATNIEVTIIGGDY